MLTRREPVLNIVLFHDLMSIYVHFGFSLTLSKARKGLNTYPVIAKLMIPRPLWLTFK